MKFLDYIRSGFKKVTDFVSDGFNNLIDFLEKPFSFIVSFFDGIFYFITVLFNVVVKIVMIFVAFFQFLFAIGAGFMRTARDLLTVQPSANVYYPSSSATGFKAVIDVIAPTGLYDVVPMILIALVWGGFIMKIIGLIGGNSSGSLNGSARD